jgi:AraC-like DNA-binding protein
MNSKKPTENINELTEEFLKKGGLSSRKENLETLWHWPDKMGKGSVREIDLRPGLKMVIMDCKPDKNLLIDMEIEDSPLEFNFFLSGMAQSTTTQTRSKKESFVVGSGQTSVGYYANSSCTIQPVGKQPLSVLNILVAPESYRALIEDESGQIHVDLHSIVDGAGEKNYHRLGAMTASMHMAIHQILNCPYQGLTRRMYLEGLALELIAHLMAIDTQPKAPPALRPSDQEKIHHAKEILIRDLENPPTLFELARCVGLSHTKLNRGFREIFDTTAFGYLRQQRIERSRLLLEEGMMNVAEVAYAAGFSSPSHFAKTFLKYFGAQPNSYLKEILSRGPKSSRI